LVGEPKEKRPLGSWEGTIRVDLGEIGWEGVDWIHLGQVGTCCEHGNEPSGSIKGGGIS